MTAGRLREFRVILNEAELARCDAAGIKPEELIPEAVRGAIAILVDAPEDDEEGPDAPADEEEPIEEETVAEEETEESVEAPSF